MALPRKLKPPKMGLHTAVQTVWPRHRRWVRAHSCCVPSCVSTQTEFAHLRSAANSGMARKPHDAFGVSLCPAHHDEQHRIGIIRFSQKYQIDLWSLAVEFTLRSPDRAMRASLKLVPPSPNAGD
jgi:hypothetical protein